MQYHKRWFLPVLFVVTLLLVACGGAAATPTPVVEDTTAAPTTATDSSGGDAETGAVATKAPAATEEAAEPTEEAAEPTEVASDDASDDTAADVESVESLDGVNSYRFTMEMQATGEAFEADDEMAMMGGGLTIEGAIVKEPPAQLIEISLGGSPAFGFSVVDGKSYTNFGGEWVESTESGTAPNVDDFLPFSSEDIAKVTAKADKVGEEDVDGRPATHYHATKEQMAAIAEEQGEGESFDLANADEAEMDFWVDEEFGFISKMEMHASGAGLNDDNPELEGEVNVQLEYRDVNEDIEIEAPEVTTTLPGIGDVMTDTDTVTDTDTTTDTTDTDTSSDSTPADLEELLGFSMDLPEDTKIEVIFDIATLTVPLPQADAQALIVDAFESNDYTLDEDASYADFGLLQYGNGDKVWSVSLYEGESSDETTVIILPVTQ